MHTHARTHACTHARTHVHTHTHTQTFTHTHTHTHTFETYLFIPPTSPPHNKVRGWGGGGGMLESPCLTGSICPCFQALSRRYLLSHSTFCNPTDFVACMCFSESNPQIVQCTLCRRQVGLWNFKPAGARPAANGNQGSQDEHQDVDVDSTGDSAPPSKMRKIVKSGVFSSVFYVSFSFFPFVCVCVCVSTHTCEREGQKIVQNINNSIQGRKNTC